MPSTYSRIDLTELFEPRLTQKHMLPRSSLTAGSPFPQESHSVAAHRLSRSNRSSAENYRPSTEILGMDLEQFRLSLKVSELEEELWQARRSNVTQLVALLGKIQQM